MQEFNSDGSKRPQRSGNLISIQVFWKLLESISLFFVLLKYVEIELKPRYAFQSCEKQFTSVIKKNLNPIFNEVFEL